LKRISETQPNPKALPSGEALRSIARTEPLGLYIHLPFCIDRCTYCSFTTTCDHTLLPAVLTRLGLDMTRWGQSLDRPQVDTLYLGGGTPSILPLGELSALQSRIRTCFDLGPLQEATIEANPGTVELAWMQGTRRMGWDRISLGVQTLDDKLLARLGRIHDAREGLAALKMACDAGFERISADLMIGIPGQDLARVISDARAIAKAGANHLSIYMLDLDKACPMKTEVEQGILQLPSDEEVAESFEVLQEELPNLGFLAYEISNYAQRGHESIHNTRYWERRPYLGLGPSAASHLEPWRWTESADIQAWSASAGMREVQWLEPSECLAEIPLLGLRMLRGIDWDGLRAHAETLGLLKTVSGWEDDLAPFLQHGLLVREGPILRFSRKGLLLSNQVLQIFV
jgi:oxygen-independent coproporphyrinogen III oxidase